MGDKTQPQENEGEGEDKGEAPIVEDGGQRSEEIDELTVKEIADRTRKDTSSVPEEDEKDTEQIIAKDKTKFLEALGRFSVNETEQLIMAFEQKKFKNSSTLGRDCDFETAVINASLYPDYFTIDDIISCLSSDDQNLQPGHIQKAYPFLEEFEGFPVSIRIGLHGPHTSIRKKLLISPEEASEYLDLAETGRFTGLGIVFSNKDGISSETILSYDEKFDELEIHRLVLSRVSPNRALELTDKQLASIGVAQKEQEKPRLSRRMANWGFMAVRFFRGDKKSSV